MRAGTGRLERLETSDVYEAQFFLWGVCLWMYNRGTAESILTKARAEKVLHVISKLQMRWFYRRHIVVAKWRVCLQFDILDDRNCTRGQSGWVHVSGGLRWFHWPSQPRYEDFHWPGHPRVILERLQENGPAAASPLA